MNAHSDAHMTQNHIPSTHIYYVCVCSYRRLTETLALVGDLVNVDFGAHNGPKGYKQMVEISVSKVLWKMVDEQVAPFRALLLWRRLLGWLGLLDR